MDENNLYNNEYYNPIINNSGLYQSICVQIDIGFLAINTIFKSEYIYSLNDNNPYDYSNNFNDNGLFIFIFLFLKIVFCIKIGEFKNILIRYDDIESCNGII